MPILRQCMAGLQWKSMSKKPTVLNRFAQVGFLKTCDYDHRASFPPWFSHETCLLKRLQDDIRTTVSLNSYFQNESFMS